VNERDVGGDRARAQRIRHKDDENTQAASHCNFRCLRERKAKKYNGERSAAEQTEITEVT
jgi:hypothetical protein